MNINGGRPRKQVVIAVTLVRDLLCSGYETIDVFNMQYQYGLYLSIYHELAELV